MSDIDWNEEVADYDANAALSEMRAMWLQLARKCSDVVANCGDWLADAKSVDEAMQWAARAEACMWRATGDADAIDAHHFIPQIRDSGSGPKGENSRSEVEGEAPQSGGEAASPNSNEDSVHAP